MNYGLPKSQHIKGKTDIARLLGKGHYGTMGSLKYCWVKREMAAVGVVAEGAAARADAEVGSEVVAGGAANCAAGAATNAIPNRIMVSVSKRFFKRAVKRNLLKRRIREAYRTQKHLLAPAGIDILFIYNTKEILPYADIHSTVGDILRTLVK